MSRRVVPAWILCLVAGSAALAARQATVPSITVVGFAVDSATKLPPKATTAMADQLAVDLVESGRFRVMDREWLGPDLARAERLPLARVRDVARAAGVDYLIVGRVSTFTERLGYRPSGPRVQPFSRPFAGYPMQPVRPVRPVSRRPDYLRLSLEIVETKTGSILTETSSTCPVPPKTALRVPALLLPASPIAAAAAAIAVSHRDSPALDPGVARALTSAGQVITRWTPPDSASK